MKIRECYVSNSSSSSYIIEFKNLFQTIRIAGEEISVQDFFNAIEINRHDSDTEMKEIVINDKESKHSLLERINGILEWMDDDEYKAELIELKRDIEHMNSKNGPYFARFDISYHNNALNFLYRLLKKYELFKERYASEG